MRTIALGTGGPQLPEIGLGCMQMSGPLPSTPPAGIDDTESIATIRAALDAGITFVNTGDFYGAGHNESLIGRALKGRRDEAFISVKTGLLRKPGGGFGGFDARPAAIKNALTYTLQRLGTDYVDLYQPCRVDPAVPIEESVGAIAELIAEGKVRHLGLSELNAEQLTAAHAVHPVTALEIEYSLAQRTAETGVLAAARELGIGVVAFGLTASGLLTGAVTGPLADGDHRSRFPRFQPENLAKTLEGVAVLEAVAAEKSCTSGQLAIAWVLTRDALALVGMTRRTRVPENLQASDIDLTPEDLARLDGAFPPGSGTRLF